MNNKFFKLILIVFCVFSLTACNLKFVVEKEQSDEPEVAEQVEEKTDVIVNNPVQEGNYDDKKEEEDDSNKINTTDNQNATSPENQNAQNNISTTGNQSASSGTTDNSTQMVNGITFIKLDPTVIRYAKEDLNAFSNATLSRLGETLQQNTEVIKTAESEDKSISQIKTSAGRIYYVQSSSLSSTKTEVKQTQPQEPQNNNQQNQSNTNNNSNNNPSYSSNTNNNTNTNTQPSCSGICWPGGSPDTTISGIGCKLMSTTAYLTAKTYIYASPTGANQLEWLAAGETVNVTAICQNNYAQVLLANGQYVYIDGNYLRR